MKAKIFTVAKAWGSYDVGQQLKIANEYPLRWRIKNGYLVEGSTVAKPGKSKAKKQQAEAETTNETPAE